MARWLTLAVVLGVLGGLVCPAFAEMDAPRPQVPARGTEGPDISAKARSGYLLLLAPSTYPPTGRGVEGPEER